jgi:uncharacterized membrane protein YfcA
LPSFIAQFYCSVLLPGFIARLNFCLIVEQGDPMLIFAGALLAGIISGMGLGGGVLLVPLLVFWGDTSQLTAQAICLISFLPTAGIAAWSLYRQNELDIPCAKSLIPWTLCGALPGALLATLLPNEWLRSLFGIFLIILGCREIYTFWQKPKEGPQQESKQELKQEPRQPKPKPKQKH